MYFSRLTIGKLSKPRLCICLNFRVSSTSLGDFRLGILTPKEKLSFLCATTILFGKFARKTLSFGIRNDGFDVLLRELIPSVNIGGYC
jgi:hypothetical protein